MEPAPEIKVTVETGEVEDVIEDAAENASRPSIRRMFGAKYNKDGFLILRDRNFT